MSRAATARRIATVAAYGGGGIGALGALGAGAYGLLAVEATLARRAIGTPPAEGPRADGLYGSVHGAPLTLVVLGDSSAAGLGAQRPEQTVGALVAAGIAELAGRPVRLATYARVGAVSEDLLGQAEQAAGDQPDIAVIMVGANDVTHRIRPADSVRLLDQAVRRLREIGCEVVVGTCPDLGTIEPIPHPLKLVARQWSRALAAAQTVAVVEAGGRTVSLGSILGPEFLANHRHMFSPDRFHPSPAGYAAVAAVIQPSVAAALGLLAPEDEVLEPYRGDTVAPLAMAAAEAATTAGTEVAATRIQGRDRGPRGRWAQLRHRRRRPLSDVALAEPDGTDQADGTDRADAECDIRPP